MNTPYNENNTTKETINGLTWMLTNEIFTEGKKQYKKVLFNDFKTSGMVIYLNHKK